MVLLSRLDEMLRAGGAVSLRYTRFIVTRLKDDSGGPSDSLESQCQDPMGELVERLQQGTDFERDFDRLYRRCHAPLVRFFVRRGLTAQVAEELTQDTFVRVYKSIGSFAHRSRFARWLFEIAGNVYCNELRRARTAKRDGYEQPLQREWEPAGEGAETGGPVLVAREPSPYDDTLLRERLGELRRALATLPPQMRHCIFLRHQGCQYSEIAEVMNISIETVKAHLHQARVRLCSLLADEASEAER